MTGNEKWLNMLAHMNFEVKPDIQNGELISKQLSDNKNYYRITLGFDKMLSYNRLVSLMNAIKDYLINNNICNDARFSVIYKDQTINSLFLDDYLTGAIELLCKTRHEVASINLFEHYLEDGSYHFIVHSNGEESFVKDVWNNYLIKFFNNYGINNLSLNISIDTSEMDLVKRKEIQQIALENEVIARNKEIHLQNQANAESNSVQDTYKGYHRNSRISVNIDEIPTTNMALMEYTQLNGTDRISFDCVVIDTEIKKGIKSKNQPGRTFNIFIGTVTNFKDSIQVKKFFDDNNMDLFAHKIDKNVKLHIDGKMTFDQYANEVVVMADVIDIMGLNDSRDRYDGYPEKRVELHAHTKMSMLDSVLDTKEYIAQAKRFGHTALAVTDHENLHAFPEFFSLAKKAGLKPIGGVEVNYIDLDKIKIALTDEDIPLADATYTIFDLETTGLCIDFDDIIEIGAVKVRGGMIVDTFSTFVKPKKKISPYIEELTEISNDTVYDAPSIEEVLPKFKEFIQDSILVGHNVRFDSDFIYAKMKNLGIFDKVYPCIDTIQIARCFYGPQGLKRFNLGSCAKYLKAEIEQQHRAIHDSRTTNNVFQVMLGDIQTQGITNYNQLNTLVKDDAYKYVFPTHLNLLIKNMVGKKNLYKLVSDSQTKHYFKYARVTSDILNEFREGLLIGSGCVNSELFRTAYEKTEEQLRAIVHKYDFVEVQPPQVYTHLFEKTNDEGAYEFVIDTIKRIIKVCKEEKVMVCATGDVHELIKEDGEMRKILLSVNRPGGGGAHELDGYKDPLDMHYMSTTEMLEAFNFLDKDLAYEIVITNTNKIADMVESFDLFPDKLFAPRDDYFKEKELHIPSMEQALIDLCNKTVHEWYGETLPQYVQDRMDKELNSIIKHKFSSIYYTSKLLIQNSVDHGYTVGSRGSVGSSFVATLMGITEVNPLHPHYRCPKCKYSAFKQLSEDEKAKYPNPSDTPQDIQDLLDQVDNGFDLPIRPCPRCGTIMVRNGVTCDFEVFLGFKGDKTPDIDLNFASAFKDEAHLYCQKIFGKNNAFRAGTILTAEKKTTFAYARDFYSEKNITKRKSELERIATFLVGSKRSTGQHPGGVVVVPDDIEVYDVIPVQLPPVSEKDDLSLIDFNTTHFDYHTFESNLLKLDMLGHDDPLILKKIFDNVKAYPNNIPFRTVEEIPFVDDGVLSLFSSKEALHIEGDDLNPLPSGTIGVPEFGTDFVRGMLKTANPKTYYDLIKISGLAHGTDVWFGNAEELVKHSNPEFPEIEFKDVIGCRDDILTFLVKFNVENSVAFKLMEQVRKGKHLSDSDITMLREHNVPEWFIWTCNKIEYLFPKAHATAYVTSALRIAWFKVHEPIYYYAAYFSVRAKELEAEVFASGKNAIHNLIVEIKKKIDNKTVTDKEANLYDELFIALEMVLRGYSFKQIDINKSLASDFVITQDQKSLLLPFSAIPNLGVAAANSVVEARKVHEFVSKKDVQQRTSLNKTQFAKLEALGVFDSLPDDDPFTLF